MLFIADTGREIDSGPKRKEIPQVVENEWRPVGSANGFDESAGRRIVIVDLAVAKIADPKFGAHEGQAPRRIQIAVSYQMPEQMATGVEDVNEAVARTRDVIVLARTL